ncbi:uncharacterized protein BDZ99DRAFT_65046 [Mytilinidion resinicola]|uniref:Uncharacterized protein n=1 Tax=Mytilinidion resinicola TaxID=574789 RepID=A0A6A6YG83_9PEZI|nr:uncharacterized protein BDZ99DRAFT_65046 [Mytilinidion resinicola]KAF2807750.1 hypothetical protein BDZ99DRAFT_65046 [Mytilinidion resinicola]
MPYYLLQLQPSCHLRLVPAAAPVWTAPLRPDVKIAARSLESVMLTFLPGLDATYSRLLSASLDRRERLQNFLLDRASVPFIDFHRHWPASCTDQALGYSYTLCGYEGISHRVLPITRIAELQLPDHRDRDCDCRHRFPFETGPVFHKSG